MVCLLVVITITASLLPFSGAAAVDPPDNDCVDCHQSLYDREISKLYIHPPFLNKQCRKCHIASDGAAAGDRGFMTDRTVRWLAGSRLHRSSYWFSLPAKKIDGDLLVDILAVGGKVKRREISLPPFSKIKRLVNKHLGPHISGVRIVSLQRGLFLHATLAWQTDREATGQVVYGAGKINKKTSLDRTLSKEHFAIISGLRPGRVYNFRVLSADIFGNKSHSKLLSFSTARKNIRRGDKADRVLPNGGRLALKYSVFRNKGNILLKFKTNRDISIGIGVKKKETRHLTGALQTKGPAPDKHNLKGLVATTNKVCEQCHGRYVAKKNHPINIPLSKGMKMPKDFFVLNNGDITCMTCHAAHASDFEYRLVRSSKRELCISCHVAKI